MMWRLQGASGFGKLKRVWKRVSRQRNYVLESERRRDGLEVDGLAGRRKEEEDGGGNATSGVWSERQTL